MKNKKYLTLIATVITLAGMSSIQAATVDGVIKGARCHLQNSQCAQSKNDPHLILENDFVLVSGDNYYFLPNLPRSEKLNIFNETVSIEGDISGKEIEVEKVVSKQGSQEKVIWNGPEIYDDLYES